MVSRKYLSEVFDRVTDRIKRFARSGPDFFERIPILPQIYYAMIDLNEQVVPDKELIVTGTDIKLKLNPSDSGFAREFYESGTRVNEADFDHVFRQLCFDGMCYVDVGANIGYYPVLAESICVPEYIIAFEPEDQNARLLRQNADLSDVDVLIEERAASAETGTVSWDANEDLESGSIATDAETAVKERTVETIRLDDYFEKKGINQVDLLKIDVEGAEGLVLEGLGDAITQVDGIALELHTSRTQEFGYEPTEILQQLFELDSTIYHLNNDGDINRITSNRLESMDVKSELEMTPDTVHTLLVFRNGSRISEQLPTDHTTLI